MYSIKYDKEHYGCSLKFFRHILLLKSKHEATFEYVLLEQHTNLESGDSGSKLADSSSSLVAKDHRCANHEVADGTVFPVVDVASTDPHVLHAQMHLYRSKC